MNFLSEIFSKLNLFFEDVHSTALEPLDRSRELGNKLVLQGIDAQNPAGFGDFLSISALRNRGFVLGYF